jgi:hypothetical protein
MGIVTGWKAKRTTPAKTLLATLVNGTPEQAFAAVNAFKGDKGALPLDKDKQRYDVLRYGQRQLDRFIDLPRVLNYVERDAFLKRHLAGSTLEGTGGALQGYVQSLVDIIDTATPAEQAIDDSELGDNDDLLPSETMRVSVESMQTDAVYRLGKAHSSALSSITERQGRFKSWLWGYGKRDDKELVNRRAERYIAREKRYTGKNVSAHPDRFKHPEESLAVSELSRIAMLATHARIIKDAGLYDDDEYDDLSDNLMGTFRQSFRHLTDVNLISGWAEEEFVRALCALDRAGMFSSENVAPPLDWLAAAKGAIDQQFPANRKGERIKQHTLKLRALRDAAMSMVKEDAVQVFDTPAPITRGR